MESRNESLRDSIFLPNYDSVIQSDDFRLEFYRIFINVIDPWYRQNEKYIKDASSGKKIQLSNEFIKSYEHNFESFITDYNCWSSKESKRLSINIFVEIARTNFLLMYNEIKEESDEIRKLDGMPSKNYKVLWSMEKSKYFPNASNLAIMMYKQTDIIKLLLYLTETIDQVSFDSAEELEFIVRLLQTRNGVYFCQTDIEYDSKMTFEEYATFCTIYFNAIYRRLFYYKIIPKSPIKFPFENCKRWFEQDVCGILGSEGFEDLYAKSCEECYQFPGDVEWFKFRYPDLQVQTGPVLDSMRKDMAKKYYTDYRISKESALGLYNQITHAGQCSRIFIINAINHFMNVKYGIQWKDGIVIRNDAIEGNRSKLMRKGAPYIVQIYSRYSVYDDSKIYTSDDIYQVFAYWCDLLRFKYNSEIFGVKIDTSFLYA